MSEIKSAIKLKPYRPKALAIPPKVEPSSLKIEPLDKFLKRFEVDFGDVSRFDKNQHTASLLDTRLAYSIDMQRQCWLPENPQLLLLFLCIRLVNYIQNMNLACVYLEDIPSAGDS